MVVAETAAQASDAATMIGVNIAPLPAVVDVERAIAKGAPVIWPEAPDNVAIRWQSGDPAAVDAAFAGAAHVTRLKLVNTRIFANPIEPRTSIAQYDAAADRFTWITPSQGVRYMVRVLCDQVFKIPDERMHVLTYDVGGAFGSKEQPYPEDVALLHAARVLGRPVKWQARAPKTCSPTTMPAMRSSIVRWRSMPTDTFSRCAPPSSRRWAPISAATARTDRSATRPGGLPLVYRTPLVACAGHGGHDECRADRSVSRGRPRAGVLHRRAAGRRSGAANEDRPRGFAPPQSHSGDGHSLQNARQAGSTTAANSKPSWTRPCVCPIGTALRRAPPPAPSAA